MRAENPAIDAQGAAMRVQAAAAKTTVSATPAAPVDMPEVLPGESVSHYQRRNRLGFTASKQAVDAANTALTSPPTAAPIGEPGAASQAAPAPAAPFHESKALNELAIMARRAKVTLSPDDYTVALGEMKNGSPAVDAIATVIKKNVAETMDPAAAFNARFGLKVPTEAETKFPKGQRGKPAGSD
jgi:hypothetical protein